MKMLSTAVKNLFAPKDGTPLTNAAELDQSAALNESAVVDEPANFEASQSTRNAAEQNTDNTAEVLEDAPEQDTEGEFDGFVDPDALPAGTTLHNGAFKIDRMLGRGGLSITYSSHSVASGQKVVVKEFFPPGAQRAPATAEPDGTAAYNVLAGGYCTGENYEKACAAFLEKARSVSRVWHPNVVMIYDSFAENNTAYMVMKFLKGNTLQDLLEERSLSEEEAVAYATQIGQGLEALHKVDLIHGDIHPGNVMVCRQSQTPSVPPAFVPAGPAAQSPVSERVLAGQRVFLIDCGLNRLPSVSARPVSSRPDSSRPGRTRPGSIGSAGTRLQTRALREPQPIGAAGYAPLEQYGSNRPVGPQTDIYALGATLYHLLTGQVPVEALDRAQGERLPDPYSLNPRVSRPLSDAVMWAMGLQSAERPSTVRVFLERLSHCVGQAAPTAAPQAPEKFISVPREAAVSQPRHSKHLGGSNNWGEYSHKTKQRLGLAALLTTTIGLAAWTLWRGSTTEPQPPQQPAQGTSQDLSSQQRPTAGPPVVAVPPKLSDKSAQGSRASNQTAGATAQLNTPQGDTPQRDTAQPNIPGAVRRNAVATVPTVVPAAPSTRRVAEGAISAPTVDSDGNTNRVESNRADVNRAIIGREERLPAPVRKSPLQKAQTRNQISANTLRTRQTPENRNTLPRRSARQQQVTAEPGTEPRAQSRVSPRTVLRRDVPRGNLTRRAREKSTSEADLPQLPDTTSQDGARRETGSEADLPPG